MQLIHRDRDFYNFHFPEREGFDYGFNLYALVAGTNVLLIDAAFRSQIKEVKRHLESEGLELTHVLATHFHNDHIAGLMHLPDSTTVLGSPDYHRTLTKDLPQKVTPVSFSEPFRFGSFTLSFTSAPGHSACSILTDINGEYLHAGDNLMSRYDGKRIVPWVERESVENHINSLEMLKEMGRDRIILSHGPIIEGKQPTAEEIDLRLFYLNSVKDNNESLTIEKALPDSPENWVSKEFFSQLMESSSDRK